MLDRAALLYQFPQAKFSSVRSAVYTAREGLNIGFMCKNPEDVRQQFEAALHELRHDLPTKANFRERTIGLEDGGSIRFYTSRAQHTGVLRGVKLDLILESGTL